MIFCMKSGKDWPLYVSPFVLLVMIPLSKSTSTSSPASMDLAAAPHSMMGRPMLMEFR